MPERNQDRFTPLIYVSSAAMPNRRYTIITEEAWNRAMQQILEGNKYRKRINLPLIELIDDLCPEPMARRYRQQYFPPASMSFEIRSDIEEPECEDSDELTEFLNEFTRGDIDR